MTGHLSPEFRDAMTAIGRRIAALTESASPGRGVAVGSTGERDMQEAEALCDLLRGIRNGLSTSAAAALAKQNIREIIERHNGRRKGDVNWPVSAGAYDTAIDYSAARLERAMKVQGHADLFAGLAA